MRRFGSNKKNPNPPWPAEQSVVVIPPGSNSSAIGLGEEKQRKMSSELLPQQQVLINDYISNDAENNQDSERMLRKEQIMGNMYGNSSMSNTKNLLINKNMGSMCDTMGVNSYLCGQLGKYVKIEFLFGENIHMEKYGKLKVVGKDFVALQENGTDNTVVCGTGKIKFINIYENEK